jgi:hypothetical protein
VDHGITSKGSTTAKGMPGSIADWGFGIADYGLRIADYGLLI